MKTIGNKYYKEKKVDIEVIPRISIVDQTTENFSFTLLEVWR